MSTLDLGWIKLLDSVDMLSLPLPFIEPSKVANIFKMFNLDGIILSGGNSCAGYIELEDPDYELSIQRDVYEKKLISEAIKNSVPILGVCKGLQLINVYFGGKIQRVNNHSAGTRHNLYYSNDIDIFPLINSVNSYHDFSIPPDLLSDQLKAIASDSQKHIEAAIHKSHKIYGIMWHPERNRPFDKQDKLLIKRIFE